MKDDLIYLMDKMPSLDEDPSTEVIIEWYTKYCRAAFSEHSILNACLMALDEKNRHIYNTNTVDKEVFECLIWCINAEICRIDGLSIKGPVPDLIKDFFSHTSLL